MKLVRSLRFSRKRKQQLVKSGDSRSILAHNRHVSDSSLHNSTSFFLRAQVDGYLRSKQPNLYLRAYSDSNFLKKPSLSSSSRTLSSRNRFSSNSAFGRPVSSCIRSITAA